MAHGIGGRARGQISDTTCGTGPFGYTIAWHLLQSDMAEVRMVSCHEATQDDLSRSVGDKEPHGRAHAPTSIMSAPAANSLTPSGVF